MVMKSWGDRARLWAETNLGEFAKTDSNFAIEAKLRKTGTQRRDLEQQRRKSALPPAPELRRHSMEKPIGSTFELPCGLL
jgi:hypothetical protein